MIGMRERKSVASHSPIWCWVCNPLLIDGMMVELKENELRSIPEESLSIGGADFGGSAMLAVGPRISHSGESPFTPVSVFIDQNHQIVAFSRELPLSWRAGCARRFTVRVQKALNLQPPVSPRPTVLLFRPDGIAGCAIR